MIKMISKSLFAAIALLFITTATAQATVKAAGETANINTVNAKEDYCGVSGEEIVHYLAQYGYIVNKICPITGSCNVIVTTQYPYQTIVFIDQDAGIVDYEDIQ